MKLVVSGDSWTFGSELRDPSVDFTKIKEWDIENEKYRLSHIWPNKLADMLNIEEVINLSWPSSSNDYIVRTTINWLMEKYISKNIPTNDIFIIIGFTNISRRDFFYDGPKRAFWRTIWPTTEYDYVDENINEFVELYEKNFHTPVDDMNRYLNQLHYLELFLKKYKINYLLFQAFHENRGHAIEKWDDVVYDGLLGYENDWKYHGAYKINDILRWKEIDPIRFVDKDKTVHSFHNRIMKIGKKRNIPDVFANVLRMHPNEIGHLLWAEYLFDYINEYEIMDTLNYDKQKKINLI
jgi:hypothetical protein